MFLVVELLSCLLFFPYLCRPERRKTAMARQSKNKVKLAKEYKTVGRIPMAAIRKIKEVMPLEENTQTIRANVGNTVKHNHRHIEELEGQLAKLGLTKEDYAEFVARNFNEIHLGNKPLSLVLAVAHGESPEHVAAVHLHYDKSEKPFPVLDVHEAIRAHNREIRLNRS